MIRLFVGLGLPDALRARLAALAGGVPGARWVAAENLHLTLRFIGEVENGVADDIDAALGAIDAPAFALTLQGTGSFGSRRAARALWVGAAPCATLTRLQAKVEDAVTAAGLPVEQRRFSPHVTLARLKRAPAGRIERFLAEHADFRADPFPVDRFTLYSSFLSSSGAIYTPERDYALTPRAR